MASIDISKVKPLEASTITMISLLKGFVEISAAYDLLCLIYPENPDGTRFVHPTKTRNKIPYFGVPNSIVCIKYKGAVRGIRQNEGQMNNVVSIDLQCCNKNINLKLARTKIQLTGASSEEMGNEAFKVLCAHLNMIQGHLDYKNSLSKEVQEATLEFFTNKEEINSEDFGILPENVDRRLSMFLYMYKSEFDNYSHFIEKIRKVVTTETICSKDVQPIASRISNSVYNYTLGTEISLIKMANHLYAKGFSVSLHTWNCPYLNVSIPILREKTQASHTPGSHSSSSSDESISTIKTSFTEGEVSEAMGELENDKIKVHRFIIYRGGSTKQTSPTCFKDALEARTVILDAIKDFKI
jgi:hypothetical protein